MGDYEGWAQPNGLLPGEVAHVTRALDPERWAKAEERTEQLIACIQPSPPSELRRSHVVHYLQRLIHKCLNCEVFTFGSVPLKTYLPDGDIDLTAFSKHQALKETWANEVRDVLESEEKSEHAEFHVKEVQYIQAEVKIIKCLVENIVVDISFNQLGGLCTLCFLEEVDNLIGHNHLFKRSIILVKAWCYYESRILGAHHGLISTYALETLVLYIFHVFNKSFSGPLEVLYRFLAFFSNFDWDNYCVSLWGPIPLSSLPDMTAESPRKDGGELLLGKGFLQGCHTVYGVYPAGQENQGQSFVSKHFNVVDPLRTNNNLGRSVSKGNFFRIRSAFGFGARKLAQILECPKDSIMSEIDQFFMNTWERHGSGQRPDAPSSDFWHRQPSRSDVIDNSHNNRSLGTFYNDDDENKEKDGEQVRAINDRFLSLNIQGDGVKHDQWTSGLPTGLVAQSTEFNDLNSSIDQGPSINKGGMSSILKTTRLSEVSTSMTNRYHDQQSISNQSSKYVNRENRNATKYQKGSKADSVVSDSEENLGYHFARPRSSPELSGVPNEISTQGRRNRGETTDSSRSKFASARVDHGCIDRRRKNMSSDSSCSYASKTTVTESLDLRQSSSQENVDSGNFNETRNYSNYFLTNVSQDAVLDAQKEEVTCSETVDNSLPAHQIVQDPINLIGIPRPQVANRHPRQLHLPRSFAPAQLPVPISPSVLYAPANLSGMVHTGLPTESSWVAGTQPTSYSSLQFPQSTFPPPSVPSVGMGTHAHIEDIGTSDSLTVSGSHHEEEEHDPQLGHARGLDMKSARVFHSTHSESQAGNHEIPASPVAPTGPSPFLLNGQNKFVKDVKGLSQEEKTDFTSHHNLPRFIDDSGLEADEKAVTTSSHEIISSRIAESTWTRAAGRTIKFTKDKRGRGRGNNNAEFQNPKPRESFSSSYGRSSYCWQAESTTNSMHVGEENGNEDTQSFGAANAGSLNHGDYCSSSLHGNRLAIQPVVSESNLPVMAARNVGSISPILPNGQPSTMPGYDSGSALSCDSIIPGTRQRQMDNNGVLPLTFYPTGPPFPFLTMVPVINIPSEGLSSGESARLFDSIDPSDDSCDNSMDQSERCVDTSSSYDLGESSEHSDVLTSSIMGAVEGSSMEHRDDPNFDILHSDFTSHWQNLQYGRFCQNPRIHGPLLYPPPAVIPPMYLQGHFPWDGPGRPLSTNLNVFTQLVSYGHRLFPVTSLQPNSNRPGGNLQRFNTPNRLFGEELPRYRGGTGTYLPNPRQVPQRDRQSSGNRGNRSNYAQDRNDHGDRDAGWVFLPKNRGGAGRGQNKSDARNQNEKSNSRMDRNSEGKGGDRVWDSYRNENVRRSSYQAQHTPFASGNSSVNTGNFMPHGSGGLTYGMYANGTVVPAIIYPYDHNIAFSPDPLEFGSLGPVQFGGTQDGRFNDSAARLNDGRFYDQRHNSYQANSSPGHSPSDQPSSPKQHQRSSTQRSYQLKDEDFPPLSFPNQSDRGGSNSFNSGNNSNRSSHYQAFLVTPSS